MSNALPRQIARLFSLGPWFAIACLAALAVGCGSASTNLVAPTAQKCQVSVNGATSTFGPAGGSGTLTVDTARECSWSAAAQSSWIVIADSRGGQGPATVTFSVQPNQAPQARSGAIEINGQRVTVSQEAAPCQFQLDRDQVELPFAGGPADIRVTAMAGCGWSARALSDWLTVTAGAAGNGNGTVRVTARSNPGEARTGTVLIAGQTVTVRQTAAPPPAPPPAPPTPPPAPPEPTPPAPTPPPPPPPPPPGETCSYAVTPTTLSSLAAGGQLTVTVTTAPTCVWQTSTAATWVSIDPASGTGSRSVRLRVEPNAGAQRTATVMIAGTAVTVVQAAAAPAAVRLEGRVSGLSGSCPNLSFFIGNTAVETTAATEFQAVGCSKVESGMTVLVEGTQAVGATAVVATRVRRLNGD